MRNRLPILTPLLLAAGAGVFLLAQNNQAPAVTPVPWAHEASDIAVDPAVRFGILPNGMRYAIRKNAEPPGRVSLRLHIDAGSLYEQDDQRGVAHFLEHMVFNGSKNFPDVENLLGRMQRLGIAFGAHANAYTSFDETVYMLDLPNLDEDTVQLGFDVMRDFGDGALLATEEIDKERGVILSEKRSRDSVEMRLMEKQFEFLMPDSLITHRFPIGIEEVIKEAKRDRFTDFYTHYYIPKNMTFVVVGEIDPDAYEARIKQAFGTMQNPETAGKEPDLGKLPSGFGFRTAVFADKEVSSDELGITFLRDYEPHQDTVAYRIDRMPLNTANAIIGRRFDILSKKEGSPISAGSAGRFQWFNAVEFGSVDVTPEEGKWQEAVAVLEQELRRALEYGFTPAELEEMKAHSLNAAEQAVKRASTRQSAGLAMEIVGSINDNQTISDPEENLRIVQKGLESLTLEKCHEALREFWKDRDVTLTLTTKVAPENGAKILEDLYNESRAVKVDPPKKEEAQAFAYTDFGPAGTVTSKQRVEDLDITQLVLSNNVRVNLKRTDFQKNSVYVGARFGNGQLTQPKDKPGLAFFTRVIMNAGGLGKHSADDLQRILAGRNVGGAFDIDEDAFVASGRTTPDDLELQLQLFCAGLTDPGYRDEAVRQFRQIIPMIDAQLKYKIDGAMAEMQEWTHGGDGRFAKPDAATLETYTVDDVKGWVEQDLTDSYLELTLVGDFDPETAIPLILKTVGALPTRSSTKPALTDERKINGPDLPAEKQFTFESKIENGSAMVSWRIPALGENIAQMRRLQILASVFDDRLRTKLREELGATYSPQAHANASQVFDYGFLTAASNVKPEDAEKVSRIILEMGAEFAGKGASADELERALKPALSNLAKSLRENSYWFSVVVPQSQEQPFRLDWARSRDMDYAAVTLEEINALAKEFLGSETAARVTIVSETPKEGAEEATGPAKSE